MFLMHNNSNKEENAKKLKPHTKWQRSVVLVNTSQSDNVQLFG